MGSTFDHDSQGTPQPDHKLQQEQAGASEGQGIQPPNGHLYFHAPLPPVNEPVQTVPHGIDKKNHEPHANQVQENIQYLLVPRR